MAGAGIKLFKTDDILTAADVNVYFMDQVVSVFANAGTRASAFGGVDKPVLSYGRVSYLLDEKKLYIYTPDGNAGSPGWTPQLATVEDGVITTAKIVNNAVTSAKLASHASTDGNRAVTTDHIRNEAVTGAKIAPNAIDSSHIAPGTVVASDLDVLSVTTDKIDNLAVTTGKIIDNAVTSAKLASHASTDGSRAVTTDHIRNNAITTAKIASGVTLTTATLSGTSTFSQIVEKATTDSVTTLSTTATQVDVLFGSVYRYTNAGHTTNFKINIRGDVSTDLGSLMTANAQAVTVVVIVTSGSSAMSFSSAADYLKIDNQTPTVKWFGGTKPAGNPNSEDAYTFTIFKTGTTAFTVFASQSKFATPV